MGWRRTEKSLLRALQVDDRLTAADFRVLACAMLYEWKPGAAVGLARLWVARQTGLDKRTVRRSVSKLIALHYLSETKETLGHGVKTYAITIPPLGGELTPPGGGELTPQYVREEKKYRRTRPASQREGKAPPASLDSDTIYHDWPTE